MTQDWNIATNAELQKRIEELTQDYEDAQKLFNESRERMLNCAREYDLVKSIINKRNGVKEDE